ncbi:OstA-like protein [Chitinophaga cymbidii]|uniref:Organic solvent tolerance-like N-terminal domain-containing protein n=1 Tax=Chitinophaga cymbidii TaxID=1096750 RepID=A0A512RMF3_9BACT|nr:OstA-like protein [Chitinophaga cymbidii]GEP96840.1 hypothetical protein CCY01nite_31000 [Chitinophaga cymbidii]
MIRNLRYGLILLAVTGATGLLAANSHDHIRTLRQNDTTKRINLLHADFVTNITTDSVSKRRVKGNVAFRQGTSYMYCDSADIDALKNRIEAWGRVHINQDDSIHTYSDYLIYLGNERLATLTGNAKLTDNKVVLTSPELQYDMNTKIGTYTKSGRLVNESSVLTSQEGIYYADTKDVYFKRDVVVVDPDFTLSTDTLLYNTTTKIATILVPTTINDGKTTMYVTEGFYNTESGYGSFGQRPVIEDSTNTFTANDIQTDKASGISIATGNMIWRDTAQKIAVLANYGIVDQNLKTVLATQKPVMILEGKSDTLFLAADTLFSGIVGLERKDTTAATPALPDTANAATADTSKTVKLQPASKADSSFALLLDKVVVDSGRAAKAKADSIIKIIDTSKADSIIKTTDSSIVTKIDSIIPKPDSLLLSQRTRPDSLPAHLAKADSAATALLQRVIKPDSSVIQADSALLGFPAPITIADQPAAAPKDTTEKRYIIAYHNVKIYSDSLQGVADSVYYSSIDSVFRMYKDPVLWASDNQMFGDTIFLFTKNQKADRLLLDQNALIISEAGPDMYNQVKGNTVLGFFSNDKLDSMHVNGNAENVYYVQDDDSAYISINRLLSASTHIYFENGELERVVFIKEAEATMYPFTQMPEEQKLLPGFRWMIQRKPKSKYELIGQ